MAWQLHGRACGLTPLGDMLMHRALLAAGLVLAAPAQAATTTLDFSGNICSGPCAFDDPIDQGYGSTAGLTVTWRSLDGRGDAGAVTQFVRAGRYSGNPDEIPPFGPEPGQTVAYADFGSIVGEARFELTGTGTITLQSIDTIVYDRFAGRSSVFRVYDLAYNELFDSGEIPLLETDWTMVSLGGISSTSGLILQWGGVFDSGDASQASGYPGADQGITGLVFDLDVVARPPAVPEAATWAMMIVGFGLVGGVARRRKTVSG
jgi:hypothetical protein